MDLLLPLSTTQTDVWFAQKLAPADTLYNIGGYVEIRGSVDPDLLGTAIHRALEESDSHLFTFVETATGPRQVRTPATARNFKIPLIDLTANAEPRAAAMAWMQAGLEKAFDLSTGPLF